MPAEWSAIVYLLASLGLVVFMLVVPRLLGGRSSGSQKQENFEAGVVSAGSARIRLSAKFYLVAIFFVIFDLEALYLYAYSVSVREVGWMGFATAFVFIAILFVGLVYEMKLGAMNWAPADKRVKKKRIYERPANFDLASITAFTTIDDLHTDPTGKVPAQSSGRIFAGRKDLQAVLEKDKADMANIDHINDTGRVTTQKFD
ncbi:NADH-quinone oxidoreductase subunit A [Moraxella bovis]|uniref:NADH-quinone oxidoreductase subunit A n=1 Tax=Moraxella bovis TaxID=476 RepID=A0A1T0AA55_MORBO|nr:NADH-quinone oxidoreductase subunit A [Moraxella bovis]OOR92548.1 NADH-quinone oxidoreductase subunit A [Moraxella bovis]UZA17576.1 NADH-quinone oxidoreductase subunit A [Moraxella bovis]STY94083.1 NAD(P)H-quinone oxidoreductase subunit 3 [Moraxella bovis]